LQAHSESYSVLTSLDSHLELIPTDQHCPAAQLLQVLHDLEVVVGLDCVANDAVQAVQGCLVGLEVGCDAVLAVQVEGGLRDLWVQAWGGGVLKAEVCDLGQEPRKTG
jgi:hypothetical protein